MNKEQLNIIADEIKWCPNPEEIVEIISLSTEEQIKYIAHKTHGIVLQKGEQLQTRLCCTFADQIDVIQTLVNKNGY